MRQDELPVRLRSHGSDVLTKLVERCLELVGHEKPRHYWLKSKPVQAVSTTLAEMKRRGRGGRERMNTQQNRRDRSRINVSIVTVDWDHDRLRPSR
jgi:hypothetical protein